MTFEYEQSLIFYAQKYVIYQLKKYGPKEMGDLVWGTQSLALGLDEYGLIVPKDSKRIAFTFTKDELIKGYGSREWKDRLLARIKAILRRIEG